MNKTIDLRSDTVTRPTPEMYEAMVKAPLGDDVFGDCPTVNELQALAADLVGKEASIFLPSGTMANLVAILTHTSRGQEVIVEAKSHTHDWEAGGMAALGGLTPRPLPSQWGYMDPKDIEAAIRPDDVHCATTRLLCIENTHNVHGGAPLTQGQVEAMAAVAKTHGLAVHCDGARLFNAATALGCSARDLAAPVDSVMFCLSKGLCSPVGSMLAGSGDFIAAAKYHRKRLGGGMRQAGILAACGIVSLTKMIHRLAEDHEKAQIIVRRLSGIPGVEFLPTRTNLVFFKLVGASVTAVELERRLTEAGVLGHAFNEMLFRFATHHDVSAEEVACAADLTAQILTSAA